MGYASALLRISGDKNIIPDKKTFPVDINLAAAIQLGSLVKIHWIFKKIATFHADKDAVPGFEYVLITEADK